MKVQGTEMAGEERPNAAKRSLTLFPNAALTARP